MEPRFDATCPTDFDLADDAYAAYNAELDGRRGRVQVPFRLLEEHRALVAVALAGFLPYRVEARYDRAALDMLGVHCEFDRCPRAHEAPWYRLALDGLGRPVGLEPGADWARFDRRTDPARDTSS